MQRLYLIGASIELPYLRIILHELLQTLEPQEVVACRLDLQVLFRADIPVPAYLIRVN